MPLDPFLEPLVANLPPVPEQIDDFPAFRAQDAAGAAVMVEQFTEPGPPVRSRRTVTIPVDGGNIDLKIFHPEGDGPHPAHLYIHGGGWIAGTIHTPYIDITCQERCAGADCVVVAVEYRKAPEHQFPTGLNDCHAALMWMFDHADELGIQVDRVSVGGGSAGANLAAALCLKLRDENGPELALQLLEVPALDLTLASPSMHRNATGYGLDLTTIEQLLPYYLPAPEDATHPYVSPLLASDLSGLPPAYIMSAEYDPLCDDGQRYADRLNAAGVKATYSLQEGHIHISSALTKVMPSARDWRTEMIAALNNANAGLSQ